MYKLIIYIMLLLDLCFFFIIPLPGMLGSIINNYQKIGLSSFIIVTTLILSKYIFKNKAYFFSKNMFWLVLILFSEGILSLFRYDQGIKSILSNSNHYFVIIGYFIIVSYIRNNEYDIEKLEKIIIKIAIILSSVMIIQYIVYSIGGIMFLNIDKQRAISSIRFGSIRIYEAAYFPVFSMVIAIGIFLKSDNWNKMKKLSAICIVTTLTQLLMISKGRMLFVLSILSFIYMMLIKYNNKKIKKYIMIIVVGIIIIIVSKVPVVNEFLSSINNKDYSLLTRVDAMNYYYNQIKESPLLGTGFIEAIEGEDSYYIVRGPNGMFYKDDMGVLGIINTLGIIGAVWYVFIIIKIIKILFIIKNRKEEMRYLELYGLFILIIIGTVVMNPFDSQRISTFPIFISLVECSLRNSSRLQK